MPSRQPNRPPPPIPDHEVLRKIGFGSYGEVWLARGVTGAWRAVKVVYRDDFEDAHSFEREFKGILAYEPLSRRCDGLVQILHVGRNRARGFYYYVMELGDDDTRGREIQPVDYQPRSLRGDLLKRGSFPLSDARQIAWQLADAVAFLHEHDLVHRDIKPANVIFVDGDAKLADIGLVAALGQRTYVGTEGFSPPEGPGGVQGDVYALGKVIYETSTGKDRLDFPAPPDEFESDEQRQQWLALDAIICRACNPDPRRRFRDGRSLERALASLQRRGGEAPPFWQNLPWQGLAAISGLGAAAALILALLVWQPWAGEGSDPFPQPPPGPLVNDSGTGIEPNPVESNPGRLRVYSYPSGADILMNDKVVGNTAESFFIEDREPGSPVELTLRLEGYRDSVQTTVMPDSGTVPLGATLDHWAPPVAGEFWVNSLDMEFDPLGDVHSSKVPLTAADWAMWAEIQPVETEDVEQFTVVGRDGQALDLVAMPEETLEPFLEWLAQQDREGGYLGSGRYYEPRALEQLGLRRLGWYAKAEEWPDEPAWVLRVREYQGEISVESEPDRAEVWLGGRFVGNTPLKIGPLEPGSYTVELRQDGYESQMRRVRINERGETPPINSVLVPSDGLVFGETWRNSQGMDFEPVTEQLMAAVNETTVVAFQEFLDATPLGLSGPISSAGTDPEFPVTGVNRAEAEAFAQWLTETEQRADRIGANHRYRLPTDAEWSLLAGLDEPEGSPADLDGRVREFAWGVQWPPPRGAANLAVDPDDGFVGLAPVGRFRTRNGGLRDLSGNVSEWVSDSYDPDSPTPLGIVRGGSFRTESEQEAYLSTRTPVPVGAKDDSTGFRLVLERVEPQESEQADDSVSTDSLVPGLGENPVERMEPRMPAGDSYFPPMVLPSWPKIDPERLGQFIEDGEIDDNGIEEEEESVEDE